MTLDLSAALVSFRLQTIGEFLDWLYEFGPDPNTIPRSDLLHQYAEYQDRKTLPTYVSPDGKTLAQIIRLEDRRKITTSDEPA